MRLKGIHRVSARLADGSRVVYFYAWRGGPRINAEPGSHEFTNAYNAAIAKEREIPSGNVFSLVVAYKKSAKFTKLAARTKKDYLHYLGLVEAKFGDVPLEVLSDPKIRGDFLEWRDSMAATPRKADLAWSVLALVFSVAKHYGRISVNPCERGGRLSESDRSDRVWTDAMVHTALTSFPVHLAWVLDLALWTGQRQGDLLRMKWSQIEGEVIRVRQEKTGRTVLVPIRKSLKALLERIPKREATILTSSDMKPWTGDGFRTSWRRACGRHGIKNVTFHDLRGTTVTRLWAEGAGEMEIATITGHSLKEVGSILDRYSARTQHLAERAIDRLEQKEIRDAAVK